MDTVNGDTLLGIKIKKSKTISSPLGVVQERPGSTSYLSVFVSALTPTHSRTFTIVGRTLVGRTWLGLGREVLHTRLSCRFWNSQDESPGSINAYTVLIKLLETYLSQK